MTTSAVRRANLRTKIDTNGTVVNLVAAHDEDGRGVSKKEDMCGVRSRREDVC